MWLILNYLLNMGTPGDISAWGSCKGVAVVYACGWEVHGESGVFTNCVCLSLCFFSGEFQLSGTMSRSNSGVSTFACASLYVLGIYLMIR